MPLLAPFFFPDASASVRKNPRKQTLLASWTSIGIQPNSLKLAVYDGISDGIKTDRGGTMLTDLAVRKAAPRDKPYKLSDGGGLYLLVTKAGQRYWRMDYRFGEKRATAALGVYPTVTLAEARAKRLEIKSRLPRASILPPSARSTRSPARLPM